MGLYISDSRLGGKGTFTRAPIKKGTYLKTLSGEIINLDEVWKRIESGQENYDDPLQIGKDLFIDLDEPSRQINHSCDPNCCLKGRSELFAIKDIKAGDELTYDYSTTVSKNVPTEVWSMNCICGSKNCRHVIGNVLTIPSNQLERYRKIDALQDYILEELSSSE